ncbi:MAG: mechanosensitive ion channel family protein [Bacteroidales bacterium]|nr:mechanosensitive ion channel family protein [Bacteroidales bacterium]
MKTFKKIILPILVLTLAIAMKCVPRYFSILPPEPLEMVEIAASVLLIAGFTWILIAVIRLFFRQVLKHYDIRQADNLRSRKVHTQYNILERIIIFIIILTAISITLMLFEDVKKIGFSLFASAGIATVILGLAAQKVIGTILAGLQIAITQPIRIDDVVIVEKEWGWIEEIALTYVVVRIWDKRRLVLPSTYFIEQPFQNWTRTTAEILGTVFIYASYHVPIDALRDELTRLLNANPIWDGQVNNMQVTDAKENMIEIRALVSARNSSDAWDLRVFVREHLIGFLQKNYPECLPVTRVLLENEKK